VPWFTVRLQSAEAFSAAETVRATYPTFLERPNWPTEGAAAFLRYDHSTGETHFFLQHSRRPSRSWLSITTPAFARRPRAKLDSRWWSDSPGRSSFS